MSTLLKLNKDEVKLLNFITAVVIHDFTRNMNELMFHEDKDRIAEAAEQTRLLVKNLITLHDEKIAVDRRLIDDLERMRVFGTRVEAAEYYAAHTSKLIRPDIGGSLVTDLWESCKPDTEL